MDDILDKIWFQHQGPNFHEKLSPVFYSDLMPFRPKNYILSRIKTENEYKKILGIKSSRSFLYASVFGFNKLDDPKTDYPGYTFFFKMDRRQIDSCLFGLIDRKYSIKLKPGASHLLYCLYKWLKIKNDVSIVYDDALKEYVDPRVEVMIPFSVEWDYMIPQEEDR
jgi:hypothetical protein